MSVSVAVSDRSPAGAFTHRVSLDVSGTPVPDGDGGFTVPWTALTPSPVWAAIAPATVKNLERVAATVVGIATHLVTIRYHSGVTLSTRVTYGVRVFTVLGIQNQDERNIEQTLLCAEVVQ